jgi:L,D-peptidoglycan transpeptidase YkuD (ErfK/YbiS/YcfS/YnhG family)
MHRLFFYVLLSFVASPALYASDTAPAYVLRVPDSIRAVFIAETSKFVLHRYENRSATEVTYGGESYLSIGQNGDGKQRRGDRRTPLGIYFVTEQLDTERMHEKYGISAFVLDYPNVLDKQANRTGDGIWLHGVDARGGKRPGLDTDGCLALPNEELALIEPLLLSNTTPVIIGRTMRWLPQAEIDALRTELEGVVAEWSASLANGDMHAYLSLYGDDFRHWEMDKSEWTALLLATLGARPITAVAVSDLLLLADPVEADLFLSRFKLAVTEGNQTVVSTKRLYWRRLPGGDFRIVAEDAG